MSQKSGQVMRKLGRIFRERQIYHRSDGVVRFIKLSTRTQVGLASVMLVALCWVAYSSVNFVFKEQIILAKDREKRNLEVEYRVKLSEAEEAYDDINTLNVIFSQKFDAAISQLENRHETLRAIVQNKRAMDDSMEALAATLSGVGDPSGQQIKNGNRIMADPVGREPTPRQSREARIREDALREVLSSEVSVNIENEVLADMRRKTAELSARQIVLMAGVEEEVRDKIAEIERIIEHTGVENELLFARAPKQEDNLILASFEDAQGGPDIHPDNISGQPSVYFQAANRIAASMDELSLLTAALSTVPLSTPTAEPHRKTSFFGVRWDPFNRSKRQGHYGLDMRAGWNSPVLATAPGRVSFAGVRSGFGNTVEIDHGNGYVTRYAHLNRIKVKSGNKVDLHDRIGLLGSSGRSTGPHIHYEVLYKGRQVDPMRFIEAGRYVFES